MTWNDQTGEVTFTKGEKEPLEADALVVDETSMVDLALMRALLAALRLLTPAATDAAELLPVIAAYNEAWDGFEAILPISAHSGDGLSELMAELQKFAAPGPQLFPDGETSDQPERQVIGEILREKMLLCLDKEIPHGAAVEITKFSERDSGVVDVDAVIYCEKASHKGIIIGKQGAMLKKISSLARHDMEKFMGTKIYLETWVKVKENWRENAGLVRTFGYDE